MFLGSLLVLLIGGGFKAVSTFVLVLLGFGGFLVIAFTVGMLAIMLSQNCDTRPRRKKRSKKSKHNT